MFLFTFLIFAFCFHAIQSQLSLNLNTDPQDAGSELSNNNPNLKTVAVKGVVKYKPGGDSFPLSILINRGPGMVSGSTTSSSTSGTNPTSGSSGQDTSNFKDYEKEALELHNKFRAVHGSQPMIMDETMNQSAQKYAEKLAQLGDLQHSTKEERAGQGENLSYGCSSKKGQTIKEAVTNWYNEVCDPGYDFNVGGHQSGTGHFTQVVWNASVKLGIGRAEVERNGMKCAYFVGRYEQPGNMGGAYKINVKKGSFDQHTYCSSISEWDQGTKFSDDKPRVVAVVMKKSNLLKKHH